MLKLLKNTLFNMVMKSYIDLEQSKILSKILPIESADMQWIIDDLGEPFPFPIDDKVNENEEPCWSLTSLLCNIPSPVLSENSGSWTVSSLDSKFPISSFGNGENPVDACYEMILLLNKHNYYD